MPSSLQVRPTSARGTSRSRAILKASAQARRFSSPACALRVSMRRGMLPAVMPASVAPRRPRATPRRGRSPVAGVRARLGELGEDGDGDVDEQEEQGEQQRESEQPGLRCGVGDLAVELPGQRHRPAQQVPAVPAQEAAEVDAEAAEPGGGDHERPAGRAAEGARDDVLHQIERHDAQQEACPGEPEQHQDIVPAGDDVAHAAEVQEVGEDVRGVGEEDEPDERREDDEGVQHRTARMVYSHTAHYWFLMWNLALAWVPFVFAGVAYTLASARRAVLYALIVLAALVWLVFFPNAPYILTDFLHLGSMGDIVPGWYDVLMLFWFAWTGLLLGVVSLYLMQDIVARAVGGAAGWAFVIAAAEGARDD